jgi:hypothetical protein
MVASKQVNIFLDEEICYELVAALSSDVEPHLSIKITVIGTVSDSAKTSN